VTGTAVGSPSWIQVTPSRYPWERDALEFIHERFPTGGAYKAWANFEFVAPDGSINEVDLLAATPRGVFLVEIKSWPERVEGDAGTWYRLARNQVERAEDNPLYLTNQKAKRLKSLLGHAKVAGRKGQLPFIAPLVFLSHPDVEPRLERNARTGVCVRDPDPGRPAAAGLPGIATSLTRITPEDRERRGFRPLSTKDVQLFGQTLEAAGIRETRHQRRVGDYELGALLEEGPGFQEYAARHVALKDTERRVRIFTASSGLDRETVTASARREFRALDPLEHPGILRPRDYVEHETGPALIYDRERDALPLDHYLAVRGDRLDAEQRIEIIRQVGEALAYAHARGVIHRALAPRSVLVSNPDARTPRLRLRDWHTAHRELITTDSHNPTAHLEQLVESNANLYLAPEATRSLTGEHLDVFGLGAIAFRVFTSHKPAASLVERQIHLDRHGGLDIGAVVDGAGTAQRLCVLGATTPDVSERTPSVKRFLEDLDAVEEELTEPVAADEIDPTTAGKGDTLLDWTIQRRLGSGGTAVAYLVHDSGEERVLKVATDAAHNSRFRSEAEVLRKIDDPNVVKLYREDLLIGGRAAILVEFAGEQTIAERLKTEGPLGLELLERFGEDLLRTLAALEDQGVAHRDIKPANIGVRRRGRSSQLRPLLFDFSLSRAPLEAVGAGTPSYLDPFMRLPPRGRFDLHAERFATAMTLHEMATGQLPRWGDGLSDPAVLDAEVTIEPELFDPAVAEPLAAFFRKALARKTDQRFDTAEDMLRAWRACFAGTAAPSQSEQGPELDPEQALANATVQTGISALALSPRARSALERAGIETVSALIATSEFDLRSLPGVGAGTRGELIAVFETLRERLADEEAPDVQGLDLLVRQLVPRRGWAEVDVATLRELLGWQSVADVAEQSGRDRAAVAQVLERARERWIKSLPSVTRLRDEIADLLAREGGFLPVRQLEEGVLSRRGAAAQGEERTQLASAAVRAAVEAEARREQPRFVTARLGRHTVIVAPDLADVDGAVGYLASLGERARQIAGDSPVDRARALEELSAVELPAGLSPPAPGRLMSLAAAMADEVAANDRGELYPVGMDGKLALQRSIGALVTGAGLSLDELRDRVLARYPRAQPPPSRPALDRQLEAFGLRWDEQQARYQPTLTVVASSELTSASTAIDGEEPLPRFEKRLERARDRFLALTVRPRRSAPAETALANIAGVTPVALDGALIRHMRTIAAEKHAQWDAVLRLDSAQPSDRNWRILTELARDAAGRLRDELLATPGTVLASRPGLLARYGLLDLLDDLRRQIDASQNDYPLEGLWLLVPSGDGPPTVNGQPVPVIDENEWARVPSDWVESRT
jgi:serine/threonine protein kinase